MRKHPAVELLRYLVLILMACISNNPVTLVVLWLGSYFVNRKVANILTTLGIVLSSMIVNGITNHKGETYLIYLNDNIVTLESLVYGAVLGLQIAVFIQIMMIMSKAMTSDKIVIVTSYLSVPLSLLISMSIRSVNRYKVKISEIFCYQKASAKDNLLGKMFVGINTISIMINWALENGIETSDSMRCRGYGSTRRTSYRPVRANKKDIAEIIILLILAVLFVITQPWVILSPRIEVSFSLVNTVIVLLVVFYEIGEEKIESKNREFEGER